MVDVVNLRRWRATLALLAVLLACGVAACGSDGGSDDGASATAAQGSSDEQQIEKLYGQFVKAFYGADPAACELMTERMQKWFGTKFGQGPDSTCEKKFAGIDASEFSPNRPYVVDIKIRGNTAIAGVKTKTSNVYQVLFAKQDGEWKMDSRG